MTSRALQYRVRMCGHFFAPSALDLHLDLDDVYEAAANGNQYTTVKRLALFLFDSTVSSILPDLSLAATHRLMI